MSYDLLPFIVFEGAGDPPIRISSGYRRNGTSRNACGRGCLSDAVRESSAVGSNRAYLQSGRAIVTAAQRALIAISGLLLASVVHALALASPASVDPNISAQVGAQNDRVTLVVVPSPPPLTIRSLSEPCIVRGR